MKQQILNFFKYLTAVQEKTLAVLQQKQSALVKPDRNVLSTLAAEEQEVLELLQQTRNEREQILTAAQQRGLNAGSVQTVCEQVFEQQTEWKPLVDSLQERSRQIQFASLTNWTMSQKSLVHLTQILEFIETRGEGKTTYCLSKNVPAVTGGGFIDKAA
ncbi:MAG: flagellar protein FlgN [Planctomycetaceae bacterium]|jgi:uncharacterized coiled-coil DUF342 family protein|nr:flagellar protein FlgN [Planctomycetaceae bacterium]